MVPSKLEVIILVPVLQRQVAQRCRIRKLQISEVPVEYLSVPHWQVHVAKTKLIASQANLVMNYRGYSPVYTHVQAEEWSKGSSYETSLICIILNSFTYLQYLIFDPWNVNQKSIISQLSR